MDQEGGRKSSPPILVSTDPKQLRVLYYHDLATGHSTVEDGCTNKPVSNATIPAWSWLAALEDPGTVLVEAVNQPTKKTAGVDPYGREWKSSSSELAFTLMTDKLSQATPEALPVLFIIFG